MLQEGRLLFPYVQDKRSELNLFDSLHSQSTSQQGTVALSAMRLKILCVELEVCSSNNSASSG